MSGAHAGVNESSTPLAVIDALARAPEILVPMVREVPRSVLRRRPAPGRWSAHEHACHLAHVHGLFFERLDLMLREPEPFIAGYQPGEQDSDDMLLRMDLDASLDRYVADRARLVARLRTLDEADWARRRGTRSTASTRCSSCSATWRCTTSSTDIASRSCCCVPIGGSRRSRHRRRSAECGDRPWAHRTTVSRREWPPRCRR